MRKILSKIKRLLLPPPPDPIEALITAGIVKVGEGTRLEGIQIFIPNKTQGVTNIEIGKNCSIRGDIAIYSSSARITIGDNVYIGPGTVLECAQEIVIGDHVLISSHCNVIDTNSHSIHSEERKQDTLNLHKGLAHKNWDDVVSKKIEIGDSCWLGLRSIIIKGVVLAKGTIVAAGSVVTHNTQPFSVMAGNPARQVKTTD